jgi:hypothetical protein
MALDKQTFKTSACQAPTASSLIGGICLVESKGSHGFANCADATPIVP